MEVPLIAPETISNFVGQSVTSIAADDIDATFKSDSIGVCQEVNAAA